MLHPGLPSLSDSILPLPSPFFPSSPTLLMGRGSSLDKLGSRLPGQTGAPHGGGVPGEAGGGEKPTLKGMQVRLQEDEVVKSQVWARSAHTGPVRAEQRGEGGAAGASLGETHRLAKCRVPCLPHLGYSPTGRLSGTVSPFRAEQGTSLETPSRARASSCQAVGTTWFFSSSRGRGWGLGEHAEATGSPEATARPCSSLASSRAFCTLELAAGQG